jgi:hypothetical protein
MVILQKQRYSSLPIYLITIVTQLHDQAQGNETGEEN